MLTAGDSPFAQTKRRKDWAGVPCPSAPSGQAVAGSVSFDIRRLNTNAGFSTHQQSYLGLAGISYLVA